MEMPEVPVPVLSHQTMPSLILLLSPGGSPQKTEPGNDFQKGHSSKANHHCHTLSEIRKRRSPYESAAVSGPSRETQTHT
jgi:hypothetical protein